MVKTKLKTIQRDVKLAIGDDNREVVVENLVKLLADEHILYVKTRNFHWNVQGMSFGSLHVLFEQQYGELSVKIDNVAERIRILGYFAPGQMSFYLEAARLKESDDQSGEAKKMLDLLVKDHEAIASTLREDIETAEEKQDVGTADFLTALMEFHEKTAWMLRAHLE